LHLDVRLGHILPFPSGQHLWDSDRMSSKAL
jgi:hypothetical protein